MNGLRRLALRLLDSNHGHESRNRSRRLRQQRAIPADVQVLDSRVMLSATAGLQLVVTSQPPAIVTAGQPFSMTVEVQNAQGAVQTDFNGQVSVGEYYYGNAIGDLTVTAVNGVAKFTNVALTTAVSDDFLVFSSVGSVESNVNSSLIQVNAAAATKLLVSSPTILLSGGTFNLNVVALDNYGNIAKSFQRDVTVGFGTNPTGATLGGNLTVSAVNGIAKFTGLNIDKAGAGYTLTVSDGVVVPGTTQAFKVVDPLVITKQPPASITAGDPFDVVVEVQNVNGVANTSYNGMISVSASTLYNGLSGTLSVTAVNGVATFSGLRLTTPTSAVVLHFKATGLTNGEVASTVIQVKTGVATKLSVTSLGNFINNAPFSITAIVQDALGNTATSFQGQVTLDLQANPTGAVLGGVLTATAVNGVAKFSNLSIDKLGTGYRLRVSASGLTSATTTPFNVLEQPNHAPVGTSKTVTTLEDQLYVFRVSDFGFTDPNDSPQNTFQSVVIKTLPIAGKLRLDGVAVTAGQTISVEDISAGKLQYTPTANKNGASYASLTFRVRDNGGTANGGIDTNTTSRVITINITPVNDPPVGVSKAVTVLEDKSYVFQSTDFAMSDPLDSPQNTLAGVVIVKLPTAGTLKNGGVDVTLGQLILLADIKAGKLVFTPAVNKNGPGYANFQFRVKDNGGTANGGLDTDQTSRTMILNVTPVNDAPVGVSKTVTMLEDQFYVFKSTDFAFSDPNDSPQNAIQSIVIGELPAVGTLTKGGITVAIGQVISITDIASGQLRFTPVANKSGSSYASFMFRVRDNGGTASGGVDTDLTPRMMKLSVTPVNDAPVGASKTVTMAANTSYKFKVTDFAFTDPIDSPPNALAGVVIGSLPTAGVLTYAGVQVKVGQLIAVDDIRAGKLEFTPAANKKGVSYASFQFRVRDNGGTANGGVDTDQTNRLMTISVT